MASPAKTSIRGLVARRLGSQRSQKNKPVQSIKPAGLIWRRMVTAKEPCQRHDERRAVGTRASASDAASTKGGVLESDNESDRLWMEAEDEESKRRNGSASGEAPDYSGMAEAFQISPKTAFGIMSAIAFAALLLPLALRVWSPTAPMNVRVLTYVTMLFGFYMAWNIGANDVANAMGTSVGSGALTLRQAVLTAAVLEFSGAFLVGSHVSHTMQKGILKADIFMGKQQLLFTGMLSSLAAAGTWLQVRNKEGFQPLISCLVVSAFASSRFSPKKTRV